MIEELTYGYAVFNHFEHIARLLFVRDCYELNLRRLIKRLVIAVEVLVDFGNETLLNHNDDLADAVPLKVF